MMRFSIWFSCLWCCDIFYLFGLHTELTLEKSQVLGSPGKLRPSCWWLLFESQVARFGALFERRVSAVFDWI